jgi:SOS-response transcriptional repressor LexA
MTDLTRRQREIYSWIWWHTLDFGYQPSYREIMDAFGITSPNGVRQLMRVLAKKGFADPGGGQGRALRFVRTPDGEPFAGFKHEGRVHEAASCG